MCLKTESLAGTHTCTTVSCNNVSSRHIFGLCWRVSIKKMSIDFNFRLTKLCMVVLVLHYGTDFFLHVSRALHLAEYKFASIGQVFSVIYVVKFHNMEFDFYTSADGMRNPWFSHFAVSYFQLIMFFFSHGLGKYSVTLVRIADGNFNTPSIRYVICSVNAQNISDTYLLLLSKPTCVYSYPQQLE